MIKNNIKSFTYRLVKTSSNPDSQLQSFYSPPKSFSINLNIVCPFDKKSCVAMVTSPLINNALTDFRARAQNCSQVLYGRQYKKKTICKLTTLRYHLSSGAPPRVKERVWASSRATPPLHISSSLASQCPY